MMDHLTINHLFSRLARECSSNEMEINFAADHRFKPSKKTEHNVDCFDRRIKSQ